MNLALFKTLLVALFAALLAAPSTIQAQTPEFGPLKGTVFGAGENTLAVFLHGDISGGGPAVYHNALAQLSAGLIKGVTAIALLRPGYDNGEGLISPGNNHKRWDQYTRANNDLLAETLQSLNAAYPDHRMIAIGHSGGAAQLGVVIARYPGIVDTALLVSCPCNIGRWRSENKRSAFKRSQSPQYYVDRVAPETVVVAITGSADENTFPALGRDYITALVANGGNGRFELIQGGTHWDSTMSTSMFKTLKAIVQDSSN